MRKEITFIIIGKILMLLAVLSAIFLSFTFGSEFLGGSSLRISYDTQVEKIAVEERVNEVLSEFNVAAIGEEYIIKADFLTEEMRVSLIDNLDIPGSTLTVKEFNTFGPSISADLIRKSIFALIVSSILIIIFVAYAFRSVSKPVSSWKYGVVALSALIHDMLIPLGFFSVLAPLGAEVDVLFVMALLATIGYSVNDTLVIFDRIRENLKKVSDKQKPVEFNNCVNKGVKDSYRRSIYTSLTTSIPLILLAIYVPAVSWFSLALLIGIVAGTYSSLFFAPSILKVLHNRFPEKDEKKELSHYEQAETQMLERLKMEDQ